jgi:hypothetical protein
MSSLCQRPFINVDMTEKRTPDSVAGEGAVRKARSATVDPNCTTTNYSHISTSIDVDMSAERTRGSVAGEGAVRKARSASLDKDSTGIVYSIVSANSSMST